MRRLLETVGVVFFLMAFSFRAEAASTSGSVSFSAKLVAVSGKWGSKHFAVAWVTKEDGTFIKTLWMQGKSFTSSEWTVNCPTWNTMRAGSTALDGYTSATAADYTSAANNPVSANWNCKDASGTVVPDGNYKFWVQYGHSDAAGPLTTSGLLWTKRSTGFAAGYPATASFTNLSVSWVPSTVAPAITSAAPPATCVQGQPYTHTFTATGSTPITYAVTSGALPPPLTLSPAGVISGTPNAAGTYSAVVTAANGTLPNATQAFSIVIAPAIVITSAPPPATGNVGTAYSHTVTASGSGTVQFAVGSGALPPGLQLSPTGVISGTPQAVGNYGGTVRASNGIAADVSQSFAIVIGPPLVYTEGTATVRAMFGALGGSEHWWVAWLTRDDGTFLKTLALRGNSAGGPWEADWGVHCATWNTARGGSVALDGYTSATAPTYAAPHNPVTVQWNGRDAAGRVLPDGRYRVWFQYAEDDDSGEGPCTVGGLPLVKGAVAGASDLPAQGMFFTQLATTWVPVAPALVLEQPAGTALVSGTARVDFGPVAVGGERSVSFALRNAGSASLEVSGVALEGGQPADFGVVSAPVTPVAAAGSTVFSVRFAPAAAGARNALLRITSNDVAQGPFLIQLDGRGLAPFEEWARDAGLGDAPDPKASPRGDGVSNLEKYAFNLDGSKADFKRLAVGAGATAGLPGVVMDAGPMLRMEWIRRKATTNPGITYVAEFGSDLAGWTPVDATPVSIDATWERVVVTDNPPNGSKKRFGRVRVVQP